MLSSNVVGITRVKPLAGKLTKRAIVHQPVYFGCPYKKFRLRGDDLNKYTKEQMAIVDEFKNQCEKYLLPGDDGKTRMHNTDLFIEWLKKSVNMQKV